MIKALLFDLDGTLIETEEANFEAYRAACKFYGYDISYRDFKEYTGKHYSLFLPKLIKSEDKEIIRKIYSKKKELYPKFAYLAKQIPQTIQVLKENYNKYKTALVTTASGEAVNMWLGVFHLNGYFKETISGDDVIHKKPDPEAYLLAAKKLGVKPQECLVFEDHPIGFEAAMQAGMKFLDICSSNFEQEAKKAL